MQLLFLRERIIFLHLGKPTVKTIEATNLAGCKIIEKLQQELEIWRKCDWLLGPNGFAMKFWRANWEAWSKLAHLETLVHHLSVFAWESSASQTLKGWRLERMIWVPESWAVSEQGRAVVEPKYRRSGMTIGSAGFVRSSYRDRTAFVGTVRRGLGKTWCCCFAEMRILVLADVRIAWNVFEADG